MPCGQRLLTYQGVGTPDSAFVLILVHHLLTDPFSTSLQLVSPISSLSLWEYVDCADIYAENS